MKDGGVVEDEEEDEEPSNEPRIRYEDFWYKELLDLHAMTLFKCQEARNLVRKPAIISLDSDQKIQRIDEYLKADLKELKMIIKVYNKTNIKSIHHEILWQIIKQIHVRLDFDDPSRNWVKIIKMVME